MSGCGASDCMLAFLNISNIALIDELQVEFEPGLNLLTGETGSGKSIIVDALGALIGGKLSVEIIKSGSDNAFIEGLFLVADNLEMERLLDSAGIEFETEEPTEILVRRELSTSGRSKTFVNNRLVTRAFIRELRPYLVDIHGQGDQQTLFDPGTHVEMLDDFAGVDLLRTEVGKLFVRWSDLKRDLDELLREEAERLQLIDTLTYQIAELQGSDLIPGEDERLAGERARLTNVEKLTELVSEGLDIVYDGSESALVRIGQAIRRIEELAHFDSRFKPYLEGLESARALLEDLAFSLRDFADGLEFSPERLAEIESRVAELNALKRKYGGTIESALEHMARTEDRLRGLEDAESRERELTRDLENVSAEYLKAAWRLHEARVRAAREFELIIERDLAALAMENARFEARLSAPASESVDSADGGRHFGPRGLDSIEFHFSANPGEEARPLARVASGGEASRLMLCIKTAGARMEFPRTIVFDEIDTGIGGRVSEAVGVKLKKLSESNQVLCVTHQPQIARFADAHLLVSKSVSSGRTSLDVQRLDRKGRVEEIARMLTGSEITDTARKHARELLKSEPVS